MMDAEEPRRLAPQPTAMQSGIPEPMVPEVTLLCDGENSDYWNIAPTALHTNQTHGGLYTTEASTSIKSASSRTFGTNRTTSIASVILQKQSNDINNVQMQSNVSSVIPSQNINEYEGREFKHNQNYEAINANPVISNRKENYLEYFKSRAQHSTDPSSGVKYDPYQYNSSKQNVTKSHSLPLSPLNSCNNFITPGRRHTSVNPKAVDFSTDSVKFDNKENVSHNAMQHHYGSKAHIAENIVKTPTNNEKSLITLSHAQDRTPDQFLCKIIDGKDQQIQNLHNVLEKVLNSCVTDKKIVTEQPQDLQQGPLALEQNPPATRSIGVNTDITWSDLIESMKQDILQNNINPKCDSVSVQRKSVHHEAVESHSASLRPKKIQQCHCNANNRDPCAYRSHNKEPNDRDGCGLDNRASAESFVSRQQCGHATSNRQNCGHASNEAEQCRLAISQREQCKTVTINREQCRPAIIEKEQCGHSSNDNHLRTPATNNRQQQDPVTSEQEQCAVGGDTGPSVYGHSQVSLTMREMVLTTIHEKSEVVSEPSVHDYHMPEYVDDSAFPPRTDIVSHFAASNPTIQGDRHHRQDVSLPHVTTGRPSSPRPMIQTPPYTGVTLLNDLVRGLQHILVADNPDVPNQQPKIAPTNQRPKFAPANQRPEFASTNQRPEFASTNQRPEFASTNQRPEFASTNQRPEFASTNQRPEFASTNQRPEFASTNQRPDFASTNQRPDFAPTNQRQIINPTNQRPATTSSNDLQHQLHHFGLSFIDPQDYRSAPGHQAESRQTEQFSVATEHFLRNNGLLHQ